VRASDGSDSLTGSRPIDRDRGANQLVAGAGDFSWPGDGDFGSEHTRNHTIAQRRHADLDWQRDHLAEPNACDAGRYRHAHGEHDNKRRGGD
jgi:hypothetical protein